MDYGYLSLIPPLVAIGLAFITRKVVISLIVGIVSGAFIATKWQIIATIKKTFTIIWQSTELGNLSSMSSFLDSWNLFILLFTISLGVIVVLVSRAGGARAYGNWAIKKVKTKKGASFATMLLGVVIFFDDYFNTLTVGTVMKPVTDRFKMSRAKLAYLIDSTAAPVVILAPVSSWVADVIAKIRISGVGDTYPGNPFAVFLQTVFFNTYAWMTLLMVGIICWGKVEFGSMKKCEDHAAETGDVFCGDEERELCEEEAMGKISDKGTLIDLILPLAVMMVCVIGFMLYTGGFWLFGGANSFAQAFMNMNSAKSLFLGGCVALVYTCAQFMVRKLFSPKEIPYLFWRGFRIMLPANIILILAWSIGTVIKDEVQTGLFLASLIDENFFTFLLPAVFFVLSCLTSFSTGTSWGTFGIMIPIAVPLCFELEPLLMVPCVAATLAGAIYGDHASPISDTTILSSTGAGVKHIDHVRTQIPYATTVALVCFVGYLITGLTIQYGLVISGVINFVLCTLMLAFLLKRFNQVSK
ncbi:MAG: Na+/H+ antiporter NhaC family protein [bacterium]|nr:Na+/H+ antiporter NhaC family protein [bacterium]